MTLPLSASSSSPSGILLLVISIVEYFFESIKFPQWRDHLPFGLGDPSTNGLLSHQTPGFPHEHFPALPTYQDFLNESQSEHSFSKLYTFAFETPTTSLGDLTTKDSLVALILVTLTIRQIKALMQPIFSNAGRKFGRSVHGPEWERSNGERIMKFGEYVFRLIYHTTLTIYGIWYFWDKAWWDSSRGGTTNLWTGFPHHDIDVGMSWYYIVQSAYNLDALITLVELSFIITVQSPIASKTKEFQRPIKVSWNPQCRGDFREMALHHVITNILVIGSSHLRLTRIGSMVFLVHDISDIPVDMSKLANFVKWKTATAVCFVIMLVAWIITRLGILPFVILKSIITESQILYTDGPIDERLHKMYYPPLLSLVVGIIALHMFWFFIMAQMGYFLVKKGETHDLTEHKQGEDQEIRSSNTKKVQ